MPREINNPLLQSTWLMGHKSFQNQNSIVGGCKWLTTLIIELAGRRGFGSHHASLPGVFRGTNRYCDRLSIQASPEAHAVITTIGRGGAKLASRTRGGGVYMCVTLLRRAIADSATIYSWSYQNIAVSYTDLKEC